MYLPDRNHLDGDRVLVVIEHFLGHQDLVMWIDSLFWGEGVLDVAHALGILQ